MRWLAHEALTPLNSLFMGLQILNSPNGPVRMHLPPGHEDHATLDMCCSSAEQVLGVLVSALELRCVVVHATEGKQADAMASSCDAASSMRRG